MQEQKAVTVLRDAALLSAEAEKLEIQTQLDNMTKKHGEEMSLLKGKLEVRKAQASSQ